jgi:hypothetical protein
METPDAVIADVCYPLPLLSSCYTLSHPNLLLTNVMLLVPVRFSALSSIRYIGFLLLNMNLITQENVYMDRLSVITIYTAQSLSVHKLC